MLQSDTHQDVTPQEVLNEFKKPIAIQEQVIDLKEIVLGGAAREAATSAATTTAAEREALITKAQVGGINFADAYVRAELLGIATKIENRTLREKYQNDRLTTYQLLPVLNYASSVDLKNFALTLNTLSLANGEVRSWVADKLDNALHYFNEFEKHDLIDTLLAQPRSEATNAAIAITLRSSEDLEELVRLVDGTGADKLLATKDAQVREYVAHAVLDPLIRAVQFPGILPQGTDPAVTEKALNETEAAHQEVLKICSDHPLYTTTQVAKDYIDTAYDGLNQLERERAEQIVVPPVAPVPPKQPVAPTPPTPPSEEDLQKDPNLQTTYNEDLEKYTRAVEEYQKQLVTYTEQLKKHEESWKNYEGEMKLYHQHVKEAQENLRQISNINSETSRLEYRYGVNITYGASDYLLELTTPLPPAGWTTEYQKNIPSGRWTEADVADIKAVLEGIPESKLIFSRMLREIERVNSLGWGVLGARYEDGRIKIADLTIGLKEISDEYEGKSSLAIVLAHEIGHGLQIGGGPSWISTSGGRQVLEAGEPQYDFDEYMALSGWEPVPSERWHWYGSQSVSLDGKVVGIGVPVDYDGKKVVLVPMSYRVLLKFDADAEFSSRWYAKASPWEDWAEAFSEYTFLPERLIQYAPEKFQHIDREFRKYEGDQKLQQLLEKALSKPKTSVSEGAVSVEGAAEEIQTAKRSQWVY